ncbi:MAG TPA: hypothetical protein VFL12_13740 [Thermoanaerobaculia bacterium]|nr:hypothetical protein [Thermoanaerobaculia bacterium]
MRNLLVALAAAAFAAGCASGPAPSSTAAPATSATAGSPAPASPTPTSVPSSGGEETPPRPASYLPPPPAPGSSPFAGGDGTSADQAVVVLARTEDEGIDLEHHWIFDHYGRFRKKAGALASADGRHYDVITVELGDHSEKTIYFDITAFYGVMDAPAPPEAPPPPPR